MRTEVLVVGSGMAGAMAAHSARAEGREVTLVSKGYGATALSGGGLDLQGTLSPGGRIRSTPAEAAIVQADENREHHPYGLVQRWGQENNLDLAGIINRSLQAAVEVVVSGGGPRYQGEPSRTLLLPNVAGTWKDTCFCQETMLESDLLSMEDAKILVVGVRGYSDFPAEFIARSLEHTAGVLGEKDRIHSLKSCTVSFPKAQEMNLVSFRLADDLEDGKIRGELKETLSGAIRDSGTTPTHLFLPAVLGRKDPSSIARDLEEDMGCHVCEVMPTRASVPGYRLFRALEESFEPAGINYEYGEVVEWEKEDRRVVSVGVSRSGRRTDIEFKSIVLATGKLIGGGLTAGDVVKETIFSLPAEAICSGRETKTGLPPYKLLGKDIFDDHPLFHAGVFCDNEFRIRVDGRVAYENLFACGVLLGGANNAREKNGMGIAATTGYAAGKCAAGAVGL